MGILSGIAAIFCKRLDSFLVTLRLAKVTSFDLSSFLYWLLPVPPCLTFSFSHSPHLRSCKRLDSFLVTPMSESLNVVTSCDRVCAAPLSKFGLFSLSHSPHLRSCLKLFLFSASAFGDYNVTDRRKDIKTNR